LLFDEGLLMVDLLSRFPSRQVTDQIIETLRHFSGPPKARQQSCAAGAKGVVSPIMLSAPGVTWPFARNMFRGSRGYCRISLCRNGLTS
jgi:hypothetical protein